MIEEMDSIEEIDDDTRDLIERPDREALAVAAEEIGP